MAAWKNFLACVVRRMFVMFSVLTLFISVGLQARPASAAALAFVRIIHASPDAGTVDLFVDGNKLLSNFQFGTITGYTPIGVGAHKVQLAVIGTGINAAVLTQTITVEANTAYTVAGLGTKSTGFSLQVFTDNNFIAGNNVAKVRVYHLSPGTGTVNVETGGKMIVNALSYPEASDYVTEPAGSYTFNVSASQTNETLPVTAELKTSTITSIFAVGMFNGNPKFQFVNAQVAGTPGVPGTGSDPHALPANTTAATQPSSSWLWLWGILTLLLVGIGGMMMRRKKVGGVR